MAGVYCIGRLTCVARDEVDTVSTCVGAGQGPFCLPFLFGFILVWRMCGCVGHRWVGFYLLRVVGGCWVGLGPSGFAGFHVLVSKAFVESRIKRRYNWFMKNYWSRKRPVQTGLDLKTKFPIEQILIADASQIPQISQAAPNPWAPGKEAWKRQPAMLSCTSHNFHSLGVLKLFCTWLLFGCVSYSPSEYLRLRLRTSPKCGLLHQTRTPSPNQPNQVPGDIFLM